MDLATLIGLLIGLGGLAGGFLLEGGHAGMLWVHTAFIIVIGGTIGATVISYTGDELKTMGSFFKQVFVDKKINYAEVLEILVETADKARREGLLSLESQLSSIDNEFLTRGLQLVIDGTDPDLTRTMLEMDIEAHEKRQSIGHAVFMTAGGYAPTMGIIGTVMGLVHVLSNMAEPEELAGAIAVAFLATLYGVSTANVLWIPFATKCKIKGEKEVLLMDLILEGVLSIQAGENPRVIREKLLTFVPTESKKKVQQQAVETEM